MKPAIHCSKRVHYWNFGFIPSGSLRHDLRGKLFGHPNLLKRLQAREIMSALHLQPSDTALDLGCGAGFFTVEMAKMAQKAYGIDINPYVKTIQVPPALRGRLEYIQVSAERLPFAEEHFDKVLASEVLPMIPDPNRFLEEIRRVLKSGGRLLIANGAGHPNIEEAYRRRPLFFQWLKKSYPDRMPASYQDYCADLQASFGTAQKRFLEEADIRALLEKNGFRSIHFDYSPGYRFGLYFSWSQFLLYLRTGRTISQKNFLLRFCLFSLIRLFERRKFRGGLLCMAQK
jgi:ubiquinone/menaquinone biosynthesis C-methylase UbiE